MTSLYGRAGKEAVGGRSAGQQRSRASRSLGYGIAGLAARRAEQEQQLLVRQ